MTDNEIIQRVREGHTDDFAWLVSRYADRVMAFVGRMVTIREDAEDLVQDTFLQVYRELHRYDGSRGTFSTWLLHIAYTQTLMFLRRRKPTMELLDNIAEEPSEGDDTSEMLRRSVSQLPAEDQTVVHLYYAEDLPLKDIASVLGHDAAYWATRLQRIRKKLSEKMKLK